MAYCLTEAADLAVRGMALFTGLELHPSVKKRLPLLVVVVAAVATEGHSVGTGQNWLRSVHRVGES